MSIVHEQNLTKTIREQVENRHWQLFEARLKNPLIKMNKKNYTNSNDYYIINHLNKNNQLQIFIEPNQRWQKFSNQLTNKSNEINRLMSIFHNVWIKNWNVKQINDAHKCSMTDTILNKK